MLYLIETKPITYIRLTCKHVPKHNTQLANLRNNYDSWKKSICSPNIRSFDNNKSKNHDPIASQNTLSSNLIHEMGLLPQKKKKKQIKNHALFNRNQTNNLYPFDMQARPKT